MDDGDSVTLLCGLGAVVPAFLPLPGLNTTSTLAGLAGSAFTSGSFLVAASTSSPPGPVMAGDGEETQAGGEEGGVNLSLASSTDIDLCQAGAMVKRALL